MRRVFLTLAISLIIVGLGGRSVFATSPQAVPEPPPEIKEKFDAIASAARISDPITREHSLREAIREGLLSPDPTTRRAVFGYLSDVSYRWLDLRPFVDLLEEHAELDVTYRHGLGLADDAEFFRAPRDERLEACARAIRDGTITLKRGTPFLRVSAIDLAVRDGLVELLPLIEQYHCQMAPEDQKSTPLAEVRLKLSLCGGAEDRTDAARRSAEKLAGMPDEELRDRAEADTIFTKVLWETADYVCARNPFTGEVMPACEHMKDMALRQKKLFDQAERERHERAAAQATEDELRELRRRQALGPDRPQWLENLLAKTGAVTY